MHKIISPIALAAKPPALTEIFNLMNKAGATHYALFGGAIRDADYAARKAKDPRINDYDMRVWLDNRNFEKNSQVFINRLSQLAGLAIRTEPSAGTGRILYRFKHGDNDIDLSLRPADLSKAFPQDVAIDRAGDSDIGICSVAIDPSGQVWATPEYLQDQENSTLTAYPIEDAERRTAYTARMQAKFPENRLILL